MPEDDVTDLLKKLTDAGTRLRRTAIVDDEFPEIVHAFDTLLHRAEHFLANPSTESPMTQRQRQQTHATFTRRVNVWFTQSYDELFEQVKRRIPNTQYEEKDQIHARLEMIRILIVTESELRFVDQRTYTNTDEAQINIPKPKTFNPQDYERMLARGAKDPK